MKLRIHVIDQPEKIFHGKTKVSSVANTIKIAYSENMHLIYKQEFYKEKQKEIYDLFIEYLVPTMEDIDHPALIEERKQNLDADTYEKSKSRCKDTIS